MKEKVNTGSVTGYPLFFDRLLQSGHHRGRALLVYQLGIVDLAGGIIDDRNQVLVALVRQPPLLKDSS